MRNLWLACAGCLLLAAGGARAQTATTAPQLVRVEIPGAGPVVELLGGPAGTRYARTASGRVYRSTDRGGSWSPLPLPPHPGLRVETLGVSPDSLLLEATWMEGHAPRGLVLRSLDGGRTFKEANLPLQTPTGDVSSAPGPRLVSDPNHTATLLLATARDGLWQSGNGGANWSRLRSFPALPLNGAGLTFVSFDPASAKTGRESPTVLVGVADPFFNLLQSDDGGKSWVPVRGGPAGIFPNHAAMDADGVLFLSYGDTPGGRAARMTRGGVWRYTPRTRQWREITPAEAHGAGFGAVAAEAAAGGHPEILYASTSGKGVSSVFTSQDGGAHWAALAVPLRGPARTVTALLPEPPDASRPSAPERLFYAAGP